MIVLKVTLENFELPLSAGVLSARARARARARAGPSELRGLPALPTRETTLNPPWARAKFFQGSDEFMSKVSAGIAAEILLEQMPPLKNSPVVMRDLLYIL